VVIISNLMFEISTNQSDPPLSVSPNEEGETTLDAMIMDG